MEKSAQAWVGARVALVASAVALNEALRDAPATGVFWIAFFVGILGTIAVADALEEDES